MADSVSFSQDALELITTRPSNGAAMIATCRAIFSSKLDNESYDSDLLNTFQLICDDSDNITLKGFGRFNSISKHLSEDDSENQSQEINEIFEFYINQFEDSISDFRRHYKI